MDVRDVQRRLAAAGQSVAIDGVFGPKSYAALFAFVGQRPVSPLIEALGKAAPVYLPQAGITTALRLRHALAQWACETGGFARMEESMNYSPQGLLTTFGAKRINSQTAMSLGRQQGEQMVPVDRQRQIANIVYGGNWGRQNLGNERPGDGWLYRGRGLTQLTGLANYTDAKAVTGIDLIMHPEQAADPAISLRIACAYWAKRDINEAADRDDLEDVTVKINGGLNGLRERRQYLTRAAVVLK